MSLFNAKIIVDSLWVRDYPNSSMKIGILNKDEVIEVLEQRGDWVRHNKGWSLYKENNTKYMKVEYEANSIKNPTSKRMSRVNDAGGGGGIPSTGTSPIDPKATEDYTTYQGTANPHGGVQYGQYFIKNARGIHGMPYQFMPSVDMRPEGFTFGRKYAEKIVAQMPLLLMTPGRPKFMKAFSEGARNNILRYAQGKEGFTGTIDDLLGKEQGRMYSFEFNYKEYYSYVNPMCQKMARFLGIQDQTIDGTKLDRFSWENFANSEFKNYVSNAECIAFYVDAETQASESFSNSTGESVMDSTVNKLSDIGREIQFLLGGGAGIEFDKLSASGIDTSMEEFDKWTNKYSKWLPTRLIDNLKQGFMTTVTGGKMIFPEIWNDSSFSRSYNISIKLRTPDCDNFSWFMNIGVPMLHLIALVAPQQLGPNGYKSPFLVRGYCKGMFNCDMGIITDMNINKGDRGRWTADGLPTEVDISFTLKDLYQILTISSDKDTNGLLSNTALLDYIANMCGININKPDIERTIDLYYTTITNRLVDIVTFDGFLGVENYLSEMINGIFKR
ncbi:MAG: hypothetical protein ACRDD7_01245 [Peptostreptococcaceae bacterium]